MDTSGLDPNLLQVLEVLLAERNATRAAARLRLSQPALLARLRDLLGDPLLLPAQRGMTPTAWALELEAPPCARRSTRSAPWRHASHARPAGIRAADPVEGFQIAMLWQDRTHEHPGHRWLRDQLASSSA